MGIGAGAVGGVSNNERLIANAEINTSGFGVSRRVQISASETTDNNGMPAFDGKKFLEEAKARFDTQIGALKSDTEFAKIFAKIPLEFKDGYPNMTATEFERQVLAKMASGEVDAAQGTRLLEKMKQDKTFPRMLGTDSMSPEAQKAYDENRMPLDAQGNPQKTFEQYKNELLDKITAGTMSPSVAKALAVKVIQDFFPTLNKGDGTERTNDYAAEAKARADEKAKAGEGGQKQKNAADQVSKNLDKLFADFPGAREVYNQNALAINAEGFPATDFKTYAAKFKELALAGKVDPNLAAMVLKATVAIFPSDQTKDADNVIRDLSQTKVGDIKTEYRPSQQSLVDKYKENLEQIFTAKPDVKAFYEKNPLPLDDKGNPKISLEDYAKALKTAVEKREINGMLANMLLAAAVPLFPNEQIADKEKIKEMHSDIAYAEPRWKSTDEQPATDPTDPTETPPPATSFGMSVGVSANTISFA